MQKVLIIGIDSFTGKHLSTYLIKEDYDVYGTSASSCDERKYQCDITKKENIIHVLKELRPDYLIHLAGISFAAHGNNEDFYKVNTIGAINILDSIIQLDIKLKKLILVSSATVYGNQGVAVLDETMCPSPANHYGASKYSMECLANNYASKIPMIIARPFNYTGIGQAEHFLIPKIVKHFKEKKETIELGNIEVSREFNDISFICESYKRLLECKTQNETVNIASNEGVKLLDVINIMSELAGYKINIKVNPAFVRKNDIKSLTGSKTKLTKIIGDLKQITLKNTLKEMYEN